MRHEAPYFRLHLGRRELRRAGANPGLDEQRRRMAQRIECPELLLRAHLAQQLGFGIGEGGRHTLNLSGAEVVHNSARPGRRSSTAGIATRCCRRGADARYSGTNHVPARRSAIPRSGVRTPRQSAIVSTI